jgi:hypothetical protein
MPAESVLLPFFRGTAQYAAEASEAIRSLPTEQTADHEGLPGDEREGLSGPLALGVAQEAEEVDGMARRGGIDAKPACAAAGQILEMARAGQPDEMVGEDLPLGHGARIGGDRVVSGRASHGPAGKPRTGPRASARPPGSACASSGSCRTRTQSAS